MRALWFTLPCIDQDSRLLLHDESGPCLSASEADHSLESAKLHCLWKPLPPTSSTPWSNLVVSVGRGRQGTLASPLFEIMYTGFVCTSTVPTGMLPSCTLSSAMVPLPSPIRLACLKRPSSIRFAPGPNAQIQLGMQMPQLGIHSFLSARADLVALALLFTGLEPVRVGPTGT